MAAPRQDIISGDTWSFESPEVSLPEGAGLGRLEQLKFGSGLRFFRTEFRVDRTCVIPVDRPDLDRQLCSQIFLTGYNHFRIPQGQEYHANSEGGLLYRIPPQLEMVIPGGQVIRHVGVSANYQWVIDRLDPKQRELMHCFDQYPRHPAIVKTFPVKQSLRKLAGQVFTYQASKGVDQMALEGLAMNFYAQVLNGFFETFAQPISSANYWDGFAFDDMIAFIEDNLDRPLNDEILADKFSLSRNAVRKLCQDCHGITLTELLRQKRMQKARQLIVEGEQPVKAVAQNVGYRHVSNFNAAYKNYFGETPGATQRLEWPTNAKPTY